MEEVEGYTIKECAEKLGCTAQAIYKQKSYLVEKGYLVKDNSVGVRKITKEGYEYLLSKKQLNNKTDENAQSQELLDIVPKDGIVLTEETIGMMMKTLYSEINRLQQENMYKSEIIREKDEEIRELNKNILGITNRTLQLEEARNTKKSSFFDKIKGKITKH